MDDEKTFGLSEEALDDVAGGAARGVKVDDPAFCAKSPYKQHNETSAGSGICRYCGQKIAGPDKEHVASVVASLVNQGQQGG